MVTCMFISMINKNLTHHSSLLNQNVFIGKSKVCQMTDFCGVVNRDFDGNTLLLEVEVRKCIYISGPEISEFRTDDKIIDTYLLWVII